MYACFAVQYVIASSDSFTQNTITKSVIRALLLFECKPLRPWLDAIVIGSSRSWGSAWQFATSMLICWRCRTGTYGGVFAPDSASRDDCQTSWSPWNTCDSICPPCPKLYNRNRCGPTPASPMHTAPGSVFGEPCCRSCFPWVRRWAQRVWCSPVFPSWSSSAWARSFGAVNKQRFY